MGSAQKPGGDTVEEAFAIWKLYGERAPHFVAEQIRSLAMADEIAGVRRWQQVSAALGELMHGNATGDGCGCE